jgi:hypothetical protein
MDRQSEAYRRMTKEDIQEELPDSIVHSSCHSLDEIRLPRDYPEGEGWEGPKDLAQAEGVLYDRIMDPTAPDDTSSVGAYTRLMVSGGDAE